jgi:excisionase family DNA binding protein
MECLFSVEESAKRLGGISPWTIRCWLSSGRLKRTKIGRRTMIRESDLETFIREENKSTESAQSGKRNPEMLVMATSGSKNLAAAQAPKRRPGEKRL